SDLDKVYRTPSHLSPLAKEYYKAIVEEMKISGVLSNLDVPLVSLTAVTLAIIRDCEETLNKEELIVDNKPHPAVSIRDRNLTQVRSLIVQLGMTPSSRASIAVDNLKKQKDSEDPLTKILQSEKPHTTGVRTPVFHKITVRREILWIMLREKKRV